MRGRIESGLLVGFGAVTPAVLRMAATINARNNEGANVIKHDDVVGGYFGRKEGEDI